MTKLTYTGKPGDFNPAAAVDRLINLGIDVGQITIAFSDDCSTVTVHVYDDPEKVIHAAIEAEFIDHNPAVLSPQQAEAEEKELDRTWARTYLDEVDATKLDDTLAALICLVRGG